MAEPTPSPVADGLQRFLTFLSSGRLYALPAQQVAEIIRTPAVARMPLAPAALIGVANLRGSVLPLVSLRGLLGQEGSHTEGTRAIVLSGASPAALAVDAIEALVTTAAERVETRHGELSEEPGEKIAGAFPVDGRGAAKILDVQALLQSAFAQRGERKRQPLAAASRQSERGSLRQAAEAENLLTFDVANQEYGLPLSAVREVMPAPRSVTEIPRTEALALGVVAYRDQLLPLLSLRGLLGFASVSATDKREQVLVTMVRGGLVGLVVDRARAIVSAERRLTEPVPALLAARSGGEARLQAVYRGEEGRRLISILAPEQLFREDVMQRLGSIEGPSAPQPAVAAALERQFVIFRLGDDEFALPVDAVEEVARVPDRITRIPKTPGFLEGVVNVRGEVLPVVDQRRRFNMPRFEGAGRRLVVVRTDRRRAGLIVDSVSEVLRCAGEAIGQPPDLTDDIARLVQGVINLVEQARIVLVLDPVELLTRTEHEMLDAFEPKAKAKAAP
ncbi:MAG TPA: chemotaxis protein CheW [Roseiarcus sp.]|jgi:purine-binding chemotaxis protein CheW